VTALLWLGFRINWPATTSQTHLAVCAKPLQLGTAALPPARWFAQIATPKIPDAITPVAAMVTAAWLIPVS